MSATQKYSSYIEIPIAVLRDESLSDVDLYILHPAATVPVLFKSRQSPPKSLSFQRIRDQGKTRFFVPTEQHSHFQVHVEQVLDKLLHDPGLPLEEKVHVLYSSATGLMKQMFEQPVTREVIGRAREMTGTLTGFLAAEQRAFRHLLGLVSYDYYTYTHSVNVFVYSVCLAQRAGYTDDRILREFGEGLLLHDIGKCKIDPSIVNSPGKLTASQVACMQQHPVLGSEMLRKDSGLSDLALDVVLHHHEKLNGSGYPDGLRGEQIHPLVRVSTIADIFDALTTRRSYRKAMTTFEAFRLMNREMLELLDQNLFRLFITMFADDQELQPMSSAIN
ncbi:MAG: hypothetical protein AMXMBFR84_44220 [Candidatus Hydrogenedentota bacterium]